MLVWRKPSLPPPFPCSNHLRYFHYWRRFLQQEDIKYAPGGGREEFGGASTPQSVVSHRLHNPRYPTLSTISKYPRFKNQGFHLKLFSRWAASPLPTPSAPCPHRPRGNFIVVDLVALLLVVMFLMVLGSHSSGDHGPGDHGSGGQEFLQCQLACLLAGMVIFSSFVIS